ncbi:hypothetical protein NM208_g13751 [Fusarium decemcellulare]|uniref:Uncharacterized protein n=1 Tax=Fusarium decemcellulare TaxID=57161 RepID=A0ACC1RL80_9HYPO|nr:hypothetical protein NM208_g13751 [Fusarium decemcellulare]
MASFGTVLPFKCENGRRAHEYVIYLTCRLFCDHFKSMFTPAANAGAGGGLIAAILGIIIGSNLDQPPFTVLGLDSIFLVIAFLIEVKVVLRLLLREKMGGRAIRYMILNVEEDDEHGSRSNPVASVVFGDYCGKGYFKDAIQPIFQAH